MYTVSAAALRRIHYHVEEQGLSRNLAAAPALTPIEKVVLEMDWLI